MYTQIRNFCKWLVLAIAPMLFLAISGMGADGVPSAENSASDLPAHRAVLRISDEMLNSIMGDQQIDRQADVRDVILGTTIYGRARIVGKPGVELVESPNQATFNIVFNGTAYSRTNGYNGPVIVHSRSITTFTATKRIIFEPGKGFHGLPPQVTARTQTFVEGIDSQRGGLIGGIIRRRAAQIEAAQHDQVTEIARQKAELRIAAAFEKSSEQRLARLNWIANLRSMAVTALRTTGNGDPNLVCCTTPHCVQIASCFGERNSTIDLPESFANDTQRPNFEIWLHDSLLGIGNAVALDLLGDQIRASDFINLISAAAMVFEGSHETTVKLQSMLAEQAIHTHKVGKWRVLEWNMPAQNAQPKTNGAIPRVRDDLAPTLPTAPQTVASRDSNALSGPRIWTSGKFTANAEFLKLDGNIVRLRRTTGIRTSIPLEKLSLADREWVRAYLADK